MFKNPIIKTSHTVVIELFIAGDAQHCIQLIQRFVERGGCFSIEPTTFVYTGGRESGCLIRSINYPRFPECEEALVEEMQELAEYLLLEMGQGSCSIVAPSKTIWITRRKQDVDASQ